MIALIPLLVTLSTAATPPSPTRWVEDHAALMSEPAWAALDQRLEAYERATGHQIIVWIGTTLDGAPLDDWAVRTFAAWKPGRSGKDDGVVIFVLADDSAIDIEVGYGLEDKVPDAIASRIIHDVMAPKLRSHDADGAITAGADAVLAAIEGHAWSSTTPTANPDEGLSLTTWILGGLVALAALVLLVTHPRTLLWLLWSVGRASGSGGGSRGFGGRGGRSGGGGARGTW